jgi:leucyl-tRNA synthetase
VPHIAEELWQTLGHKEKGGIFKMKWPSYDPAALTEATIPIVIQVNGRLRSKIDAPFDIGEAALKEKVLSDAKVKNFIQDKPIKDFIIVPKKLVNIVV